MPEHTAPSPQPARATGPRAEAATDASAADLPDELLRIRGSIDNIDAALVHMLAERFTCTQRVGQLKASTGLPPSDPGREERQIARLRRLAEDAGLDPVFAEKFLNFIVAEVIQHHTDIADSHGSPTGP